MPSLSLWLAGLALAVTLLAPIAARAEQLARAGDPAGQDVRERAAETSAWQNFAIEGRGRLGLQVPLSWQTPFIESIGERQLSLRWSRPGKQRFVVNIIIGWGATVNDVVAPDVLRNLLMDNWEHVGPQSVETEPNLKLLQHAFGGGFYFSATDRKKVSDAAADDYQYITQASLGIADLYLLVTVLTHQPGAAEVEQVLEMLRGAQRVLSD